MRIDLDNDCSMEQAWRESSSKPQEARLDLHQWIFSPESLEASLKGKKVEGSFSQLHKAAPAAITKDKGGGSAKVEVTVTWGGKDGTQTELKASGELHDRNNNQINGGVDYNTATGETNLTVGAGAGTPPPDNSPSANSPPPSTSR